MLWTICKKWALFLQQILCVQDSKHVRTVCLNIDASKVGKTLSDEELAKMDESDKFGDIAGIGRNWAHIKGGIKNFKNIYCNL
ncbi:TPA: hypothetical protein ACOS30_000877 [Campylobacter jejuni]